MVGAGSPGATGCPTWMRTMCGSEEFLDRQYGMMKAMLSNVREDGLLYYPIDGNRLANTSYPDVTGILALACENHYRFDGNPKWLDWCGEWLAGCQRVLADDGNLFVYGIHHYL